MITGHGGNIFQTAARLGCDPADIIDMSSNVNPLGPPPGLADFLKKNISAATALPEPDAGAMTRAFAETLGLDPEKVLAGNGTTQFIHAIPEILKTRNALILGPTYSDYADACRVHNVSFTFFMTRAALGFTADLEDFQSRLNGVDTVFICNPNNPTGNLIPGDRLASLIHAHPHVRFIIDESYLPFVPQGEPNSLTSLHRNSNPENLIVLNSMSKIFRIPGLRIGFIIASKNMIGKFFRRYLPWCVNSLAQAAVTFLMQHRESTYRFVTSSQEYLETERTDFSRLCSGTSGITLFPSRTSFLLGRLESLTADGVCERLLKHRILIRNCANFEGLSPEYIRISLKTREVNRMAAQFLIGIVNS